MIFMLLFWIICGVIAWWIDVRYVFKQIDTLDLILGIPITILTGPVALFTITLFYLTDNKKLNKTLKSWK